MLRDFSKNMDQSYRINSFITCKKFWADAQARGAEIILLTIQNSDVHFLEIRIKYFPIVGQAEAVEVDSLG